MGPAPHWLRYSHCWVQNGKSLLCEISQFLNTQAKKLKKHKTNPRTLVSQS